LWPLFAANPSGDKPRGYAEAATAPVLRSSVRHVATVFLTVSEAESIPPQRFAPTGPSDYPQILTEGRKRGVPRSGGGIWCTP